MTAYLGLDIGRARIGVAVSDPSGRMAFPLTALNSSGPEVDAGELRRLMAEKGAERLVAGLPLSMNGTCGPQAEEVKAYVSQLEAELGLVIELQDERLTSRQARGILSESARRQPGKEDAVAASLLLQTYLDTRGDAE